MKTTFALPSHTYNIVLSMHDLSKLAVDGCLMYDPTRMENTYISNKETTSDGHFLQYHGPEAGTIPVQHVIIRLKME